MVMLEGEDWRFTGGWKCFKKKGAEQRKSRGEIEGGGYVPQRDNVYAPNVKRWKSLV